MHLSTVAWNQHHSVYSPHFYDQNFIEFKVLPFFEEFIEIESYQKRTTKSDALVFKFPRNRHPRPSVNTYLNRHGYDQLTLNVYIKENNFNPHSTLPKEYVLEVITANNLKEYLAYQYQQDLPLGEAFAKSNQAMLEELFKNNEFFGYFIQYKDQIVAHAQFLHHLDKVELYYIEVEPSHRQKGLAAYLQNLAKKEFPELPLFAVADAQDVAANSMYQSLGYTLSYWFLQFQKVLIK
ncbi:GNAT family N-acetyltransferase [Dolosicoccus paucivorans]|uniref:GNAT family N-acetyltransferase n=1 Tax=Dolosicoccus paucivorans TaxID=84521 RepID=UPI00228580C9|nr:GNAT family N-acetyltransferase [Dolosicoccus paucivorans]